MSNDKEVNIIEKSVEQFVEGQYSTVYFIRHVFCFLREHMDLLEHPDYRQLYEEMLDCQIRWAVEHSGWNPNEP